MNEPTMLSTNVYLLVTKYVETTDDFDYSVGEYSLYPTLTKAKLAAKAQQFTVKRWTGNREWGTWELDLDENEIGDYGDSVYGWMIERYSLGVDKLPEEAYILISEDTNDRMEFLDVGATLDDAKMMTRPMIQDFVGGEWKTNGCDRWHVDIRTFGHDDADDPVIKSMTIERKKING
jgi:hypothetical protein